MLGADDPKSDIRTMYVDKLLRQPEIAMLPFPERQDGVPFAEMYVDQTVVEEKREMHPEPADAADPERALHAEMMREVVRQAAVDLWQALTERSRVVVEAPAWTGKSTLCRWVTHQCYMRTAWLPILIPFRDFAQSEKSLRQYLDENYTAWLGLEEQPLTVELSDGSQHARTVGHWLDDEWQAGKALVILDGADEEFVPERRQKALSFVTMSQATSPRVLLTSRPLGVSVVPGFAQVKLQEFTPPQIDWLVRRGGAIMEVPDKAEQFLKDMQSIENLRIRPLAGRPGHLVQMFAAYVRDGVLLTAEDDLMHYMAERRLAITGRVTPPLQPDDPPSKRQVAEALAFHLLFCRRGQAQDRAQMLRLIHQTLREVKVNGIPVYAAKVRGTMLEDLCRNSGALKQTRRGAYETYEWESVLWLQFFAAAHIARKLGENDTHFTQWVYAHGQGGQSTLQCPVCAMVLPSFSHYFWHGDWQVTITLLAGLLNNATALLRRIQAEPDDIFHQMANMAAWCLGRVRAVAPKVAKQIVDTASQAWRQTLREHRPLDVTALQGLARGRDRKWTAQVCALMGLWLKDKKRWVRYAALRVLAQYPTPEAVAALCTALLDTDEGVRYVAAEALAQHSTTPEASAALCTALLDTRGLPPYVAVRALAQHSTPEASAALCTALQDTASGVRKAAAKALAQHPTTPEVVAALCTALLDTDRTLRRAAVEALGQHPTPEASAALRTALQDTDWSVCEAAVEALGQHPTPEAVAALSAALHQRTDWRVSRIAAAALLQHSTPEAVAALSAALHQRTDWCVGLTAVKALEQHLTPEAVAALSAALHQYINSLVRWAAAAALLQHSTPEAVAALSAALQHTNVGGRWAVLAALAQHPTPEAVAVLQTVLQAPDRWVRQAAAAALGQPSAPGAVAALRTEIQNIDARAYKRTAAEALGQHPTSEAVAALQGENPWQDTDEVSPLLARARRGKSEYIWEALWHLSQRTKIWIDADWQWHPLPPVEPVFQNVAERQQVASF